MKMLRLYRGHHATTKLRHRIALAVAALAGAGLVLPLHSAEAHTHKPVAHADQGSIAVVRPVPPSTRYGAIAVADNGAIGKAWRHRSRTDADQAALRQCGSPGCKVVSRFIGCGAVAHDGSVYHGGIGSTRPAAEQNAMTRLGGGWIVTWACN
ncbi:DUF4189 domain-containing protein [Mycobacterium riyadhense]|uniref:DUF4189 domain-containing protein n=2 Tax=Mycobacterium riyadhense TaxID=486698 RepID=UPI0030B8A7B7